MKRILTPWLAAGALALSVPMASMAQPGGGDRGGWQGWGHQQQGWAQTSPVAPDQVNAVLAERGFGDAVGMRPKKRHLEVYTTRDGQPVEVKLNFDGSFHEWQLPKQVRYSQGFSGTPISDPAAVAAEAGYKNPRVGEYKRHHVEVFATNTRGENVELHIAPSGLIYKEKQVYGWGERPARGG